MSSPWHEQYEVRFASGDPPWTLQGTFIALVRAAFARHLQSPADAEISEVWLRIQNDHENNKPEFTSCRLLCGYIQRIASNCAIDEQRRRIAEAKRGSRVVLTELKDSDPTRLSLRTGDRLLAICGAIESLLSEVELPLAIERLQTKLKDYSPAPANVSLGDETISLPRSLTPERIEMRLKLLVWHGSENTILVYLLHLHGYRGVQIASILKLSTTKVCNLLKRAKALFEGATEAILDQYGDTLA